MSRRRASPPRSRKRCEWAEEVGFPLICRPSFILGRRWHRLRLRPPTSCVRSRSRGLAARPGERDPPRSSRWLGWKEYELEVMRDHADNVVVIWLDREPRPDGLCTPANSITVAPAQTLTDVEYQRMRDAAFALHPPDRRRDRRVERPVRPRPPPNGHMVVIEMNPRVSRSRRAGEPRPPGSRSRRSRRSSPVGYRLDEVRNDITEVTPRELRARRSTTSSPRCRAGRSRSSPVRSRCSAR